MNREFFKSKFFWVLIISLTLFTSSFTLTNASQAGDLNLKNISIILREIRELLSFSFFQKTELKLNMSEIIFWTNEERKKANLSVLVEDLGLNAVAKIRLKDMETKQYFDHFSPSGRGISEEAIDFGYKFILVGENIAQGDFKNSEDLVQAWMASPGHRENILKSQYSRIGISAEKVIFNGDNTWLIVQAFSRPLSECREPEKNLKETIDFERLELQNLTEEANRTLLDMNRLKNNGDVSGYNKTVPFYNSLVVQVNRKTDSLKSKITRYNFEVTDFNICLEK